jgi:hypothetical protein
MRYIVYIVAIVAMQTRNQTKQSIIRNSQPSSPTTRSQTQSARATGFSRTPVPDHRKNCSSTGMTTRSGMVLSY